MKYRECGVHRFDRRGKEAFAKDVKNDEQPEGFHWILTMGVPGITASNPTLSASTYADLQGRAMQLAIQSF